MSDSNSLKVLHEANSNVQAVYPGAALLEASWPAAVRVVWRLKLSSCPLLAHVRRALNFPMKLVAHTATGMHHSFI